MECTRCGYFSTVNSDSEEDLNKECIADSKELCDDLLEVYGSFDSRFYKIKGSPVVYIETCRK